MLFSILKLFPEKNIVDTSLKVIDILSDTINKRYSRKKKT